MNRQIVMLAFALAALLGPAATGFAQHVNRGTSTTSENLHVFLGTRISTGVRTVYICVNNSTWMAWPTANSLGFTQNVTLTMTNGRNTLSFQRNASAPPSDRRCRTTSGADVFSNWAPVPFNGFGMIVDLQDDVGRVAGAAGHTVETPPGAPDIWWTTAYNAYNHFTIYSTTGLFLTNDEMDRFNPVNNTNAFTISSGGGTDCISRLSTWTSSGSLDCGTGTDYIFGTTSASTSCEVTHTLTCPAFP